MAFLAEKERRSGSHRTVDGYARMLWPFLGGFRSPADVTPAHVLAWAHGIGLSGREPSSATVGARIACLSSYYRFLIRMQVTTANPCEALERPKSVQSVARGLGADEVRRLLAVVPATVAGRRDRALVSRPRPTATGWHSSSPKLSLARPTGFNRADDIYIRIPIQGAGEWLKTSTESA
jgi:site-specific recombinase XerC